MAQRSRSLVEIDAAALTDIGKARSHNEDQFLVGQLDKSLLVSDSSLSVRDRTRLVGAAEGQFFCVADGLGGHVAGEQASSAAMEAIVHYVLHTMPCFFRARQLREEELRDQLGEAVEAAQLHITELGRIRPELAGMGTTLTLGFLQWPKLYVVHVGDSRCYLHGKKLWQVTTDHTVLQRRIAAGELVAASARQPVPGGPLWNVIGGGSDTVVVDVYRAELEPGDTVLLCTDGLTGLVDDETLASELSSGRSAQQTCRRLVDLANANGGHDNITVVVVRIPEFEAGGRPEIVLAADSPTNADRGASISA